MKTEVSIDPKEMKVILKPESEEDRKKLKEIGKYTGPVSIKYLAPNAVIILARAEWP